MTSSAVVEKLLVAKIISSEAIKSSMVTILLVKVVEASSGRFDGMVIVGSSEWWALTSFCDSASSGCVARMSMVRKVLNESVDWKLTAEV